MRSFKRPVLLAMVAGAALIAGAIASAATGAAPAAKVPTTHVVSVRDDSYSRSSVSVKRNETVRWAWRNTSDRHSVKSGSGNPVAFASRTARGNFSFSHKFSKTGTYTIFCTVHPSFMRMKVKVTR